MRRIALINQKGGVGKTTSTVNLGAALARLDRRVLLIDLDPQANLSLHVDCALRSGEPSVYTVLLGSTPLERAVRRTATPNLSIVGSNIDLSGAELELASAMGRESLLRDAVDAWEEESRRRTGAAPVDYLLIDCPPSLGLLSVNGLVAAKETFITLQTEFFALQGMSKLIDVVQLLRRRLNPALSVTGILPCLYDNRLRLAREVLGEIRKYFPGEVFKRPIAKNIKLAEAPSYGKTIFEYAPESSGAADYLALALEVVAQESRDAELASLPRPSANAKTLGAAAMRSAALRNVTLEPTARAVEAPEGDGEDEAGELDEAAETPTPVRATRAEREMSLRAQDLPPLPLDAFEIRQA